MEAVKNNKLAMFIVCFVVLFALVLSIPTFASATGNTSFQFPYFNFAGIQNGSSLVSIFQSDIPVSYVEFTRDVSFTTSTFSVVFSQDSSYLSPYCFFYSLPGGTYVSGVFGFFSQLADVNDITVSVLPNVAYSLDSYKVSESTSKGLIGNWKFYVVEFCFLLHDSGITTSRLVIDLGSSVAVSANQAYLRTSYGRYHNTVFQDLDSFWSSFNNLSLSISQFFARITTPLSDFFGRFSSLSDSVVSRLDTLIELLENDTPTPEQQQQQETLEGNVGNIIDSSDGLEQELQDSYNLTDVYNSESFNQFDADPGYALIKDTFGEFHNQFRYNNFGFMLSLPLAFGAVALILGRAGLFHNMIGNTPSIGGVFYDKKRDD